MTRDFYSLVASLIKILIDKKIINKIEFEKLYKENKIEFDSCCAGMLFEHVDDFMFDNILSIKQHKQIKQIFNDQENRKLMKYGLLPDVSVNTNFIIKKKYKIN